MTHDDVPAHMKSVDGRHRRDQLVALQSLSTWAKQHGLIFRNPTSRIKVGQNEYGVLQPLLPSQEDRAAAAAATPAARLVPAPAAVHTARLAQIATLMLDDVDLDNRRLTIAGHARPPDDLTLKPLADYCSPPRGRR
ncbi:hypothetical protein ACFWY6_14545 [Streptomyces sp. NPDC059037]|uniref:hypothetical protein n=1 Tax=Streptomyces sp. NPDC059037 TaxID=3346710 RepID=UPI0036D0EDE2